MFRSWRKKATAEPTLTPTPTPTLTPPGRALPKLVRIEWVDSSYTSGWRRGDAIDEALKCVSVGYLIGDGKEVKTVAPHVSLEDDPQYEGIMAIPCVAITRLEAIG